MQKQWDSTKELFRQLNENCNYLVMRNYENMDSDAIFTEGHEDIDFLCEDYKKMVEVMDARPRRAFDNKVQYYIRLKNQQIKIDIRHVGDKYYDTRWQKEMLQSKQKHKFGFYVMQQEDYFYSLAYHSILQKKKLSEDYRLRLIDMAGELGKKAASEEDLLLLLTEKMQEQGYRFTYPEDSTVPNRFRLVPSGLCEGKIIWYFRRIKHFPVKVLAYMKRRVINNG